MSYAQILSIFLEPVLTSTMPTKSCLLQLCFLCRIDICSDKEIVGGKWLMYPM